MIIAGPCLLVANGEYKENHAETSNVRKTAELLKKIDNEIMFRCKLYGGGTSVDKYVKGIQERGHEFLSNIGLEYKIKVGTEIRDASQLEYLSYYNFYWVAARSSQNYTLLANLGWPFYGYNQKPLFIKRSPGMTVDEMIGIHDICRDKYGYKPTMIERGINTFCRTPEKRWTTDFDGMIRVMQERPDIELMYDPSHAGGRKEYIFPLVKAACAIGVKNFMLEVYADPSLTQTDKAQALSVEEFKPIYDYIRG